MLLINIFSVLIAGLLIYNLLVYLYTVYCSKIAQIKYFERRSLVLFKEKKINLIIYSHNNEETLSPLLESIQKQDYPGEKYTVNVILDNCTDYSAKKLEIIGTTNLWRISTGNAPIGRNKALSWLMERLPFDDCDAFVFLSADCVIKPDFLSKVNTELEESGVVSGMVLSKFFRTNMFSDSISFREAFVNTIIHSGRTVGGLNNILNTELCAMRRDLLEQFIFFCEKEYDAEVMYSILLSEYDIQIRYSPLLVAFKQYPISVNKFILAHNKSIMARFNSFYANFGMLFSAKNSVLHKEFLFSLIYPSELLLVGALAILLVLNNESTCWLGKNISLFLMNCYILTGFYTIIVGRYNFKQVFKAFNWVLISPFLLTYNLLVNVNFSVDLFKKLMFIKTQANLEKDILVNATLTDGVKEVTCQLEIQRNEELSQVIFWFKNKKMTSGKYLRTSDAVQDIINKLNQHGFALKICLNCGYFELKNDGRFNCNQGKCMLYKINDEDSAPSKFVWERCTSLIPIQAKNVIKEHIELIKE